MNDDGSMARLPDLIPVAQQHGLKIGTIADLIHYRPPTSRYRSGVGSRRINTKAGPSS